MTKRDVLWIVIAALAAASALYSGVLAVLNVPAIVWDHYTAAPMVVTVLALILLVSAG